MKNWTIGKRIALGFAMVLILFSATAITSFVMLKRVKASEDAIIKQALPELDYAARIKSVASEIQIDTLECRAGFQRR